MKTGKIDFESDPRCERALREFRDGARAAAGRPEEFWARQRRAVMARTVRPRAPLFRKPVAICGTALVLVAVALGVWKERPRALPAPDIAGGYDDALLADVERLITADVPLALEAAYVPPDASAGPRQRIENGARKQGFVRGRRDP